MDSSGVPLGDSGYSLVQTIDYFYPSVEDPYIAGKIACANVLSDLYALGMTRCDNVLMVMAVSTKLTEKQRDIVVPLLIRGSQGRIGPCCSHGCLSELMPDNAQPGDVLVLTKPLCTQVAVNAHQWLEKPERHAYLLAAHGKGDSDNLATNIKDCRARLMHKHGCHGATGVTGFGLLGHTQNLVQMQQRSVRFVIHTLPIRANFLPCWPPRAPPSN
ncbi:inactive selenide, water dikinase-like protein [Amblyomma americanum]